MIMGAFVTLQATDVTHSSWYTKVFFYLFFYADPLFTFFVSVQYLVIHGLGVTWQLDTLEPNTVNSVISMGA